MPRKRIGLLIIILLIVASFLLSSWDASVSPRYQQHLEAVPIDGQPDENGNFYSHLPLILLDTNGVEIPGSPIYDDNGVLSSYTTAEDGEKTIPASLSAIDTDGQYHSPNDAPDLQSRIRIRIHGRSSREFAKKSYLICLENEDGTDNDLHLLGMDLHHEWVLYGPYLDKTLLRNYMWYNIAGEIMDYAPNVRYCEVFLNGEYQGLYLLTETITNGVDKKGRLNLNQKKENITFESYLLRVDMGSDNEINNLNTFAEYTWRNKQKVEIISPGGQTLTSEIKRAIEKDFSFFEKSLYSFDYDNSDTGYRKFIDVNSFADYFIINEVTSNYDAGYLSTYIYKGLDRKYHMCVWDFNNCCNNYEVETNLACFQMQDAVWYWMLTKDESFTDRIISRYRELRESYLSDDYLMAYIDDTVAFLGDAIARNESVWESVYEPINDYLKPASRNPRNYQEALVQYKDYLLERLHWVDENIETLRQYSAESRVKKFNEVAN